jgi:hypothetical protein
LIDPVVIDFSVKGLTDVGKAFDTVTQRLERFERQATSQSEAGARTRVRSAQSEAKSREASALTVQRNAERIEKQNTRMWQAEINRRQAIVQRSSQMAGQYAAKLAKEEERSAQQATRAIEREEERRTRIRIRSSEMAGRYAVKAAAAEARASSAAWGKAGRVGSTVAGSVGGLVSGAGRMASMAMGLGGGMFLADAARREMSAQKQAALLIEQVSVGGAAPKEATIANILGYASQASKETGMDKGAIVEGTRAYSKTARSGDIKGALRNMSFFAKMSEVTGTDMSEIAGAAGMLQSQNAALAGDPTKMRQMLLDVYAQTKNGSLGMGEMITQAGKIGSVRGAFQGDESTVQRKLMALGQIVAPAAGEESGIMIKDFALEVTKGKHLAHAKAMGVHFNGLSQIESPEQMISAIMKSTGGDIGKITDLLGSRGGTLLRELSGGYVAAEKGGKGGGEAYLKKTIGDVSGSTMSEKDLDTRVQALNDTPEKKLELAVNTIREKLEEKLAPALEDFATNTLPKLLPIFEQIIDKGSEFAKWFADNPIKGVGMVVLGAITKDLAAAGIGPAVKLGLQAVIASATGAGAGLPGAAIAVAGSATIAVAGTMAAIDADVSAQQAGEAGRNKRSVEGSNLASKIKHGTATPEEIAKAQGEVTALRGDAAERGAASKKTGGWSGGLSLLEEATREWLVMTGQSAKAHELVASKQHAAALAAQNATMAANELAAALGKVTAASPNRSVPINERTPTGR